MRRIKVIIVIFFSVEVLECFIASTNCADEEPPINNYNLKQRSYYSNADRARLLKIFHETDTGEWGHEKRIKKRWDQLNGREMPQKGHNLYKVIVRWMKNGHAEKLLTGQERQSSNPFVSQKKIKWTPEMKDKVMEFYLESEPDKWKQSNRVKELWDKEYPEYSDVNGNTLMVQVRHLLKKHGKDINVKTMNLTEEEKTDLVLSYHKSRKHKGEESKIMRELFIKKHPKYALVKSTSLRKKFQLLRHYDPEIEEKILGRVSGFDKAHCSKEPGETSGSKQGESASFPVFQTGDFPGVLKQSSQTSRNDTWIDCLLNAGSFPNSHLFSHVDTRDQTIHSGLLMNHHISSDVMGQTIHSANTLQRNNTLDEGRSQSTIQDYPKNDYAFGDVGTSQQMIHPNKSWERVVTPRVRTSHQAIHLEKRHLTEEQRQSSKEKALLD